MEQHIDNSLDNDLLNISGLTWLPWIGKAYKNNNKRLLIVGESHYAFGKDDNEYQQHFNEAFEDLYFTRQCIYESPICVKWRNNTFENIHSVFLKSSHFRRELFWEHVAFYNFIPRLMDYRVRERPTWFDFYSSWRTFIEIVECIKPTDCVFIGVSASNSYDEAMQELKIKFTPVEWGPRIGNAYARTATLNLSDQEIKLSFIQHASQYFSPIKWHDFLSRENGNILSFLKNTVLGSELEFISEKITSEDSSSILSIAVPMHLSHKPIVVCDYSAYTNGEDDAKYLSIGHAQYNNNTASVKIFRRTGEKWSRQSEEIPINRVGDIALLLLNAIKNVYNSSSDQSVLNEVILAKEELDFLGTEFDKNKDRIIFSYLEIKRLLNEFDIEKYVGKGVGTGQSK